MHLSIPDLLCASMYILMVLLGLLQVIMLIRHLVGK